jgi:hypothetical protein
MKVVGKKIPKGTGLLFISFMALSICLLLIIYMFRAERISRLSQNNMYSGNQKNFSIINSDDGQWNEVMPNLITEGESCVIYVPIQTEDIIMRGVYVNGKAENPPMLWGEYFSSDSSLTDTPKAVVGKQYEKDIKDYNGKKYYTFGEEQFEVIGIMGTEAESRLNYMVMIDFNSAVRIEGINVNYVLDAEDEDVINNIGKKIEECFDYPASVLINIGNKNKTSLIEKFFSSNIMMNTMYVMALISFSLAAVLVTLIWLRAKRMLFYVCSICGYKKSSEIFEIIKRFYPVAGAGFLIGLVFIISISGFINEIEIIFSDILQAFGMTVGIGTLILFCCYFLNVRHRKS